MLRKTLLLSAAAVALGATGAPTQASIFDRDVVTIKDLTPQGDSFSANLAREYKTFSLFESQEMYDWPDADHFAEKAFTAVRGVTPEPEKVADWNISGAHVDELNAARARLVNALDTGGRDKAPHEAAVAQAKFDCWVEQQEEGWQYDHIAACKKDFEMAMANLDKAMMPKETPVAAVVAPAKPVAVPLEQQWVVYFDFDKANLKDGARQAIDQMAALLSDDKSIQLKITGHADRSGPADYNAKLSERRADTVRNELLRQGLALMDVDAVDIAAKGESEPAVATGDGVREPRNRRVVIQAYSVEQVAMGDKAAASK